MIEFPASLVDWIDLPIPAGAPLRLAVRQFVGGVLPVRVGRSRLLAEVASMVFHAECVEVCVRLPVRVVPLPETELA